jgi:hypothetical protein
MNSWHTVLSAINPQPRGVEMDAVPTGAESLHELKHDRYGIIARRICVRECEDDHRCSALNCPMVPRSQRMRADVHEAVQHA